MSSTKNRRGGLWGSRLVSQLEYLWASTIMESHCKAVHPSGMLTSEVTFLLFPSFFLDFFSCIPYTDISILCFLCNCLGGHSVYELIGFISYMG